MADSKWLSRRISEARGEYGYDWHRGDPVKRTRDRPSESRKCGSCWTPMPTRAHIDLGGFCVPCRRDAERIAETRRSGASAGGG